mmetsp:Transcript_152091/g.485987  ORF Transcript_152091/g.485987 Transcript_152091/m.485987 type:complete len:128 (-) Transcript_152091:1688-2071(-)
MEAIQLLQRGVVVKAVALIQHPSKFSSGHLVAGRMGQFISWYQDIDKFSGIQAPKAMIIDPPAGRPTVDVRKFDSLVRAEPAEDSALAVGAARLNSSEPTRSWSSSARANLAKCERHATARPVCCAP